MDDKGCGFIHHSPPRDDAEPELKKQKFCEDSDVSRSDSNSDGSGGDNNGGEINSDGSGGDRNRDGSCGDGNSNGSDGSSADIYFFIGNEQDDVNGSTNVFIGNEQDDVYFEEYKHMLEPHHYENSTLEEKRQYGRYFHQIDTSNCYYLDFIPTFPVWTGPRPIDFSNEDYRDYFLPEVLRCMDVALQKQKEKLQIVRLVRANYSSGYGFVYWITMDVRNEITAEVKTCICKVHFGIKGGDENDMIVEHFKFIPSNLKYLQGTSLNEQDSSLFHTD